ARTAHNDKIQGAAMAQFACEVLEAGTAATIHDGSPYAQQLQAVFAESFQDTCGGEITAQEAVTVGQTDFSGTLGNIAADSPDLIYYPIFTAEGALITQQARETAGLEETDLAGADGMLNSDWLSAAGDAAEGVYLSGPDLEFTGDFYESTFLPAYKEISGLDEPTSVFHAHSFDAYNILAEAIEKVAFTDGGTTYIPRTALKEAVLGTTDFEGITGTLTCDENGDCANAQISVSQVQDGDFVRIWPE
ncbi:MAG TPA: branched-chain amino acid ABC transporter substrate-binding protein, partial [Candidatus Limnocylindria bacterium]|nr:branched-chain amino acid ABC transporter substrate-binding protein [Candidatus Limnocylindria bacterium]